MRSPTASSAPGEAPKPVTRFPTVRAGPPPLAEGEPEELSSALLADDSSEVPLTGRVPPQPISSSSLVEDPDSDPEIEQDDEPAEAPIFAPVALAVVGSHRSPPAPGVAKPPAPRTADFTPRLASVEAPIFAPTGVVPGAMTDPFSSRDREPQFESLVASDPFARPTQPPRARDLSPDDSGRTYVAPPPQPPPWWTRPPVIIGGAVATVLVAAVLAFALRSTTPTSEQPSKSAQLASAAPSPTESSPPGQTRSTADPTLAATASRPPSSVGGSPCVLAGAPHVVAPAR